jgi:hypothetical protein
LIEYVPRIECCFDFRSLGEVQRSGREHLRLEGCGGEQSSRDRIGIIDDRRVPLEAAFVF